MEATHVEAFVVVFRYRGASPLASTKILAIKDAMRLWREAFNFRLEINIFPK